MKTDAISDAKRQYVAKESMIATVLVMYDSYIHCRGANRRESLARILTGTFKLSYVEACFWLDTFGVG